MTQIEFVSCLDVLTASQLHIEVFSGAPWFEKWTPVTAKNRICELLETKGSLKISAHSNGKLVGYALGVPHTSAEGRSAYLAELAVTPEYQGQGIGTSLLLEFEKSAKQKGFQAVWLIGNRSLKVASFYKSHHYSPSEKVAIFSKSI